MKDASTTAPGAVADTPGPHVRSVERIAAILTSFTAAHPMLTLSQVAKAASLDKNTARRLLLALSRTGLVRRYEREGVYALGIGVLKLQPAVVGPRALRETAAPYLQGLTSETGMTSFFWLPDGQGAICIERVRASGVFLDVPWSSPGSIVPLNMAAGPRVILAYISEPARQAWLHKPQPTNTHASQTDPDILRAACGRIRSQGHEIIADDFSVGLTGIGAPVFDRKGVFVGSTSVTSRSSDFDDPASRARTLAAVRKTASDIGLRLEGASPDSDQAGRRHPRY